MNEPEVSFSGNTLNVGGRSWRVDYPIGAAIPAGGQVIVLYDPDAYTEKFGQFPNLVAFDVHGQRLWSAELPTRESGDRYYRVSFSETLQADSIYSYSCQIDLANGRIKSKVFYK